MLPRTITHLHIQVDCIELAVPMVEELLMLEEKGVMAYDVHEKKEVLVVAPVLCIICDNPRASEVTNNLGPGSRMFCRMCMVNLSNVLLSLIHCV